MTLAKPEQCVNCSRKIGPLEQAYLWQEQVVCYDCYSHLQMAKIDSQPPPTPAPTPGQPTCTACGGNMRAGSVHQGTTFLQALLLFGIGLALTITGILAIIGIPCLIIALFMGGRKRPVWKCVNCGAVIERAKASSYGLMIVIAILIVVGFFLYSIFTR